MGGWTFLSLSLSLSVLTSQVVPLQLLKIAKKSIVPLQMHP